MIDSAKNVLITGGAKGLGAHLARHLSAQGHRILVLDRTASEDLAADYRETLTEYMTVDLADWSAVHDSIERLLSKHEGQIDVLINNAAARSFDDFSAFDRAEIDRCIQVNFKTPVLLTHELLPVMKQNGYGRIINIGSRSGFRAYPSGSLYCSTKNALVVFTESVGAELAAGETDLTINAICPDSFRTREGDELPRFEETLRTISETVDSLLKSERNGEAILVASRRRLIADAALALRRHATRVLKR